VIAAGLFSLGGVVIGALLTTFTQLYLGRKREQRAASRAKLLVAGELLHAQLILRAVSAGKIWSPFEDLNAFLPTSAWQENRSSVAGKVDEDLWNQLVMAYAGLELDRGRFATANRLPAGTPLPTNEAEGIKRTCNNLGRLRRKLGGGGGWLDEIHDEFKPQMDGLKDDFKRWLDGLTDDDLKKDAVMARVKQVAKDLGELGRRQTASEDVSTAEPQRTPMLAPRLPRRPYPESRMSGRGTRAHFLLDARSGRVLCDCPVVLRLQVHPHLSGCSKIARRPKRCVARNTPLPFDDSSDSVGGHSQRERQRVDRQSHFAQQFLEYLARMKRLKPF